MEHSHVGSLAKDTQCEGMRCKDCWDEGRDAILFTEKYKDTRLQKAKLNEFYNIE